MLYQHFVGFLIGFINKFGFSLGNLFFLKLLLERKMSLCENMVFMNMIFCAYDPNSNHVVVCDMPLCHFCDFSCDYNFVTMIEIKLYDQYPSWVRLLINR
jgi:hypothetical protein